MQADESTGGNLAVILSAGASTRFGGLPKALLPVAGELAVLRIARECAEAGFPPRVVVGAHSREIRTALAGRAITLVENPDWERGRTGSLQRGLEGVPEAATVLVWPVDHPFVQAKTPRQLRTAAEHDAMGVWFIPTFEGSGGHPILLRPPVIDRVRSLAPSVPLRSLLPEFGPQVVRVPVDDPGVTANVDTPTDYDRYRAIEAGPREVP